MTNPSLERKIADASQGNMWDDALDPLDANYVDMDALENEAVMEIEDAYDYALRLASGEAQG